MPRLDSPPSSRQRHWLLALSCVLVLITDQLTKLLVEVNLSAEESLHMMGPMDIVRVSNPHGAWGLRAPSSVWLTVSTVAIALMLVLHFRDMFSSRSWAAVALGLVLGGTLSNFADRLSSGAVTDFISVHLWNDVYWPTFNVADIAIVVGAFLAMYALFVPRKGS